MFNKDTVNGIIGVIIYITAAVMVTVLFMLELSKLHLHFFGNLVALISFIAIGGFVSYWLAQDRQGWTLW